VLTYKLLCQGRSVTSNWVDANLGVINGGAAFITLADMARRPHDVRIELPPTWKATASGLEPAPGGVSNHYRAADFDTLPPLPR
jgi:predicted metalloprotease with PDZ domain